MSELSQLTSLDSFFINYLVTSYHNKCIIPRGIGIYFYNIWSPSSWIGDIKGPSGLETRRIAVGEMWAKPSHLFGTSDLPLALYELRLLDGWERLGKSKLQLAPHRKSGIFVRWIPQTLLCSLITTAQWTSYILIAELLYQIHHLGHVGSTVPPPKRHSFDAVHIDGHSW